MNERLWLMGLLITASGACAKAPSETAKVVEAEPVGFVEVNGQTCYAPEDMSGMPRSQAQNVRMSSLQNVMSRWTGEQDEAFKLSAKAVSTLEGQLMASPQDVQAVLDEDYRLCAMWAGGNLSIANYEKGLTGFLASLSENRCEAQFLSSASHQLQVDSSWQMPVEMCQGQKLHLKVSNGRYSIVGAKEGEEAVSIDANGYEPGTEPEGRYLCTDDGCRPGMVIGEFEDWDGNKHLFPVGLDREFEAPVHGTVRFQVNDADLTDNHFAVINHITEFLLLDIRSVS